MFKLSEISYIQVFKLTFNQILYKCERLKVYVYSK